MGRNFLDDQMKLVVFVWLVLWIFVLSPRHNSAAQDDEPTRIERSGPTALLGLGVGWQADEGADRSAAGLGGPGLGLGYFVTEDVAIMARMSGTSANYTVGAGDFTQTAVVFALTGQYWLIDKANISGGPGIGTWRTEVFPESWDAGFIAAAAYSLFQNRITSVQAGVEWAPVFTGGGVISNLSLNLGLQLF